MIPAGLCGVCGSKLFIEQRLATTDKSGRPLSAPVHTCAFCGYIYADHMVTDDDMANEISAVNAQIIDRFARQKVVI